MRVAVITISDRCSSGEAVDESGPAVAAAAAEQGWEVVSSSIVPDDQGEIGAAIRDGADRIGADVILTTGGTGFGPRDVTPEATLEMVDRQAQGIAEALRYESLKMTPFAMLSRGVAGIRGRCVVINLPGSPRAVRECMVVLSAVLPHAVSIVAGGRHE
ncbi:MAG: MogA/MoaB family molybdenum cofactor biosynthesis protein [Chloroflexi bacterium]|nr:MogA/MoaB family molybdenum cofactor biosynthesis protein [Chloroflexota bacterium]